MLQYGRILPSMTSASSARPWSEKLKGAGKKKRKEKEKE